MDGVATGIVGGGPVADLGSLERWLNNPGIATWSFVFCGCFLLNAILLIAFLIRPGLRTISNRFVMNLTVSNLLTCVVLNLLLIMDGPYASTPDDASFDTTTSTSTSSAGNICAISEGTAALVTTSSVLSVLLIAVDQYFAVVDPLRYRARVDKLKSAVLIVSVWLVSAGFGLIASFNPSPRSLWLSCTALNGSPFRDVTSNTSVEVFPTFAFLGNETEEEKRIDDTATPSTSPKTIESTEADSNVAVGPFENSTATFRAFNGDDMVTYGLIYAIVHSVFAYLLPFAGVCWIYISIYSAAHRNSERTRRTGSRPILSSAASFCEDPYILAGKSQQSQSFETFAEEFRRIPKISSLSSIDEISETAHSTNQVLSRRRSFSSSSDAAPTSAPTMQLSDEKTASSGVVFTVGLQPVEVSASREQDDEDDGAEADPMAATKAQFLQDDRGAARYEDFVKSKYRDSATANHRRKSSHDLIYEAVSARKISEWIAGDSSSSSESEDERHYGCFDSLEVPGTTRKSANRRPSEYFIAPVSGCETTDEQPRENAESTKGDSASKTTIRRVDEEEDSVAIKTSEYTAAEPRNQVQQNGNLLFPHSYENKRSRRPSSRRSSRSGISDGGAIDAHAIGDRGSAQSSASNNAEPSSCLLTPIVTITPAPNKSGSLNRASSVRSTGGYINSLKHRISNGSLFRYREETRAARISALVIVMGLICWSPYVLLNVIKNLPQYSDHEFPRAYDVLALSFLILAAYVSPLLFGYRSRRVKRELHKLFCFRRELSYKNNRSLMAKKVLKRRHSGTLSHLEMDHRYNIFNCVYGRGRWPKERVQFVQVPDTALAVETCRSSFSSGASTQISSTSTEEC